MANGSSGTITCEGYCVNMTALMTVNWTQTYNPGDTYSTVSVSASIKRTDSGSQLGGSWFAWSTGGISVDGVQAIGWSRDNGSKSWTSPGDTESLGSGAVKVNHTDSKSVTIKIDNVEWHNTSYSNHSFEIGGKSESITLNPIVQEYTLSMSVGKGTTITVNRTSSPSGQAMGNISNGAKIYTSDVLQISGSVQDGYNPINLKVNGNTFNSGGSYTVSSNVSIVSSTTVKSFTLSISAGTGTTITINRTSSPKASASTGVLSNGAIIYHGDVLSISGVANTGYDFGGLTVNNTTFTSGNTTTVTSAVSVASTATLKSFTLSISAGVGSSITVNRTSSINTTATMGNLNNGDTIYYGDILKISMSVDRGYYLGILTVNGSEFTNEGNYTVREDVSVVSNATEISMEQVMPYVYDGTNYNLYVPYVYENGEWVQCVVSIYNQ